MTNFYALRKDKKAKLLFLPFFCFLICFVLLFGYFAVAKTQKEDCFGATESLDDISCNSQKANSENYSKEYLAYLQLSEDEKKSYGVIPRMFDVSVDSLYSMDTYTTLAYGASPLPVEYSLFYTQNIYYNFNLANRTNFQNYNASNVTLSGLPKNIGNQSQVGICWTYATLTAFESTLYKTGVASLQENLNFSELNMAYISLVKNHNEDTIGGGNFELAYEYLCFEQGPFNEQSGESVKNSSIAWSSNENATNFYLNNFYKEYGEDGYSGYIATKSKYSAFETYAYPSDDGMTTSERNDLLLSIKNHIYTYGAVTSSILYNDDLRHTQGNSTYYFKSQNSFGSGTTMYHLVSLVGWDDDFSCTISGKTHVGAFIAQNSWGNTWGDNGYFYIMYDDSTVLSNVNGFVRVGKVLEENNNVVNYNSLTGVGHENTLLTINNNNSTIGYDRSYYSQDAYICNIFEKSNQDGQYISRLKICNCAPLNSDCTSMYIYVIPNLSASNVSSYNNIKSALANKFSQKISVKNKHATTSDEYLFETNQELLYTIDLNQEIKLESEYFAVIVKFLAGDMVFWSDNVENYGSVNSKECSFFALNPNIASDVYNTSGWQYLDQNKKKKFPIIVQTSFDLGTIEWTAGDSTKVYDGAKINPNISVTNVTNPSIYFKLEGSTDWVTASEFNLVDVGTYKVFYKILANNYQEVEGDDKFVNVVINKRNLNVFPATNLYKTYGENDVLDYDYQMTDLVGNEKPAFSGSLYRAKIGETEKTNCQDVGKYDVLSKLTLVNGKNGFKESNYNLIYSQNGIQFEIKPKKVTITPNSLSKIYGEVDKDLTYTYSSLAYGETPCFSGNLVRNVGEDVSSYEISQGALVLIDGTNFKKDNYELVFSTGKTFVIKEKEIVLLPNANQSKIFGQDDPTLTWTWSGEVGDEIATFCGNLSRAGGEDVGLYKIGFNPTNFYLIDNAQTDFKANNYKLVLPETDVFFQIYAGELSNYTFEDCSFVYDGLSHYLVASITGYTNPQITYSSDNVNFYYDTISFVNVLNNEKSRTIYTKIVVENYVPKILSANLTITRKSLFVTPKDNQNKVYDGNTNCSLAFDYSGNIEGETPKFIGTLSGVASKDVNNYVITQGNLDIVDNDAFIKNNYNLAFDNESNIVFAIVPKVITIVPQDASKIYGKDDPAFDFSVVGIVGEEEYAFMGLLGREEGNDVGVYEITQGSLILISNDNFDVTNYDVKFSQEKKFLTIFKAKITIKVDDKSSYYGEELATFTFTIIDDAEVDGTFIIDDTLELEYTCEVTPTTRRDDKNVDYSIYANLTANDDCDNKNYEVNWIKGRYSILYKYYSVKFDAFNKTIKTINIEHFSSVLEVNVPEVDLQSHMGYQFNFWKIVYEDQSSSKVTNVSKFVIEKDTNFVADISPIEYNIIFEKNGGSGVDNLTFNINSSNIVLSYPQRFGYTFDGWYDNTNFEGEKVLNVESGSIGDKTFYAKWIINIYNIEIPSNNNEIFVFSCMNNEEIVENDIVQKEYNSTFKFKIVLKEKYSQAKSKMSVTIENKVDFSKKILKATDNNEYILDDICADTKIAVENINIEDTNKYIISFVASNNIIETVTKSYGEGLDKLEFPEIPFKEHFDNVDPVWEVESLENITKDYTITAIYTPNVYTVTFVVSNGSSVCTPVSYGSNVSTEDLQEICPLSAFEYYQYSESLVNISGDKTINVTVKSNVYLVYIALGVLGVSIAFATIFFVIRKFRRRKNFKWWAYSSPKNLKK